eukprot:tig00021234_g19385.t1
MEREEQFRIEIQNLFNEACNIEARWAQESPANAARVKEIASESIGSGDYGAMGWKDPATSRTTTPCPRCGRQQATSGLLAKIEARQQCHRVVAGCRMNGDSYGTIAFICSTCGLFTWWSYDDA